MGIGQSLENCRAFQPLLGLMEDDEEVGEVELELLHPRLQLLRLHQLLHLVQQVADPGEGGAACKQEIMLSHWGQ